MAYLLKKKSPAVPLPREKGRMTMAAFLRSLVKSCEGGHGLCHHLREKRGTCPSGPKKNRVMTMVIFFHTSVESSGGDHGMSSKEEGDWPSSSKRERSMTMREEVVMAYLLEKRGSGLLVLREKGV